MNPTATLTRPSLAALQEAEDAIVQGDLVHGESLLGVLVDQVDEPQLLARIWNGFGVIAALRQDESRACDCFQQALRLAPEWSIPQINRARLRPPRSPDVTDPLPPVPPRAEPRSSLPRIAIVSLLFNWPSTGGGTVHTAELARFLHRAGYPVQHLSFRHEAWGIGLVREPVDWPLRELALEGDLWNAATIQASLRQALREFSPDAVIVTDSWSMKPILAEACDGFPTFLRLAAQECLCPLNNVRLLQIAPTPRSCPRHQLATPELCRTCVSELQQYSGELHRRERALAGFGTPEYSQKLRQAFANAAGVLAVNPLIAEACKPFSRAVHVVPSGFDPDRFPIEKSEPRPVSAEPVRLLFAGLVQEPMKGFHVLLEAARSLWSRRRDFRIVVTDEALPIDDPFLEFIGWQSQAALPRVLEQCDILVCPTIAEEALGRTAVEGMAAGRAVIASAIGGLSFTVLDEATGLLFPPGDSRALVRQIERLLDDAPLRQQLGQRGRERFERDYTWSSILDRHYRPLFEDIRSARSGSSPAAREVS